MATTLTGLALSQGRYMHAKSTLVCGLLGRCRVSFSLGFEVSVRATTRLRDTTPEPVFCGSGARRRRQLPASLIWGSASTTRTIPLATPLIHSPAFRSCRSSQVTNSERMKQPHGSSRHSLGSAGCYTLLKVTNRRPLRLYATYRPLYVAGSA